MDGPNPRPSLEHLRSINCSSEHAQNCELPVRPTGTAVVF